MIFFFWSFWLLSRTVWITDCSAWQLKRNNQRKTMFWAICVPVAPSSHYIYAAIKFINYRAGSLSSPSPSRLARAARCGVLTISSLSALGRQPQVQFKTQGSRATYPGAAWAGADNRQPGPQTALGLKLDVRLPGQGQHSADSQFC